MPGNNKSDTPIKRPKPVVNTHLIRERIAEVKRVFDLGDDGEAHRLRDELLIEVLQTISIWSAGGEWAKELAETALAVLEINISYWYD